MHEHILSDLRKSYDRTARERDRAKISDWKVKERQRFLSALIREKAETLLEVGSGPGRDGRFFSYRTDEEMKLLVRRFFELDYFGCVELEGTNDRHFQSMILRKRTADED